MVRGYLIDFVSEPPTTPPHSPTSLFSSESADSRGTFQPHIKTSNQTAGVPLGDRLLLQHIPGSQREWELRLVINLKALNQFVYPEHFKMEGIHTLRDLLRPGDWLGKIDLKDAYLVISIDQTHRDYL